MDTEELLRETVSTLVKCSDQLGLSDWEQDFIVDMDDKKTLNSLSEKQIAKIQDLEEKYL